MRILMISDIHANLEALEACLGAAPAHDRVFNLGDIVGYGASPNEVTAKARSLGTVFVRGNHDRASSGAGGVEDFNPIAAMAAVWTKKHLTTENLEFLRALPQGPITPIDHLVCVHGSPRDEDEYILYTRDAFEILARSQAPLTFFGHTHVQGGYWIDDKKESQGVINPTYSSAQDTETFSFQLSRSARYLINPGSIGQPRDGDPRAAFASYDSDTRVVTFHRVPYDIPAAQKKIFEAALPERLAFRLEEGR